MLITKYIEIDTGHRVPNHKSKCRNIHGHRYRIVVGVDDKVITKPGASNEGMVIDFSDLKQIMMTYIDQVLDHGFIICEKDPLIEIFKGFKEEGMKIIIVPFIPTAENLAKWLYERMEYALKKQKIRIEYVEVYETPSSTARYSIKDA